MVGTERKKSFVNVKNEFLYVFLKLYIVGDTMFFYQAPSTYVLFLPSPLFFTSKILKIIIFFQSVFAFKEIIKCAKLSFRDCLDDILAVIFIFSAGFCFTSLSFSRSSSLTTLACTQPFYYSSLFFSSSFLIFFRARTIVTDLMFGCCFCSAKDAR